METEIFTSYAMLKYTMSDWYIYDVMLHIVLKLQFFSTFHYINIIFKDSYQNTFNGFTLKEIPFHRAF